MNVRLACISSVGIVILVIMLLSAAHELSARDTVNGEVMIPPPAVAVVDDISMDKGGGKFKYKSDDPYEAQQTWKLKGTCPTSYQSFDSAYNFQIQLAEAGQPASLNHSFSDPTGVIGRNSNRYKKKFFYYSSTVTRSSNHSDPKFGLFKAWIKDGQLKFMYVIKKANEGGKMMNMDDFDYIRQATSDNNKI